MLLLHSFTDNRPFFNFDLVSRGILPRKNQHMSLFAVLIKNMENV